MADKKYVGGGWEKKFENGGSIISISIKKADLMDMPEDGFGNIRLVVGTRRAPDEKSKQTHSVTVDQYFYDKQNNPSGNLPF
jgi:hypothetical protein